MTPETRAFWRGFWRGYADPRVWRWALPVIAGLDLYAFIQGDDAGRWVCLAFAVWFLIETGWLWRERAAIRAVMRRKCSILDAFIAANMVQKRQHPVTDADEWADWIGDSPQRREANRQTNERPPMDGRD